MAHLSFIARKDHVASFQLSDTILLGRSMDCDLFVPDVFVSRQHCRFRLSDRGWMIEDLASRNGVYFRGRKIKNRLLQDGDVIELGTVALVFNETDTDPADNNPSPFGEGPPVIELVDTLCTDGHRASAYLKKNRRKKPRRAPAAPVDGGDWTELDVELQIEAGTLYCRDWVELPLAGDLWEEGELDVEFSCGRLKLAAPVEVTVATPPVNSPPVDLVSLEELVNPDVVHQPVVEPPAPAPQIKPNRWEQVMGVTFEPLDADRPAKSPLMESTAGERLMDRLSVLKLLDVRDLAGLVRDKPLRSLGIAASIAVLIVFGSYAQKEMSKPPMYTADGKLSIHYHVPRDASE